MIRTLVAALALTAGLALPGAALAEHQGPARPGPAFSLDLRAGVDWFTLGGGLSGDSGYYGASIAGQARPGGLLLDGRVESPARAFDFRLDADVGEALRRLWHGWRPDRPHRL
jgi:hypothetical protein